MLIGWVQIHSQDSVTGVDFLGKMPFSLWAWFWTLESKEIPIKRRKHGTGPLEQKNSNVTSQKNTGSGIICTLRRFERVYKVGTDFLRSWEKRSAYSQQD